MQVLYEWDEGLRVSKKWEAAFRCFREYCDSANIVREETREEAEAYAEGEHERIRTEGIGNGDFSDSSGVVTDDDELAEEEEDLVDKRVLLAKSPCVLRKDNESDLSF